MITWVSAAVFFAALAGMWMWVGHKRRTGHVKKPANKS
jgi:hypothetical protein